MEKRENKRVKNTIIRLVIAAIVVFVIMPIAIYEINFNTHISPQNIKRPHLTFETSGEEWRIPYYKGELIGRRWEREDAIGTFVLSHGFGGGGYEHAMPLLKYFYENGFNVTTYYVYGNGPKEVTGNTKIGGLETGATSLYAVLDELLRNTDDDIYLFGHSWGGYSVANAAAYDERIKAACILSGFDNTETQLTYSMKDRYGEIGALFAPTVITWGKFRNRLETSGIRTFHNMKNTRVMIVQGALDTAVPAECGYNIWKNEFQDDERFIFKWYEDRGHNDIYAVHGGLDLDYELLDEIIEFFKKG